ncbi:hypothetical protein ZWY2020_000295 [Hordeum vulgare]|nr:hypothetical protein ZWY2020_000295 [Hordeum vulgare]
MAVSPVFRDGAACFQHHGRTEANITLRSISLEYRCSVDLVGIKSANAPAKIRRSRCSSSTNLYSCC